MKHTHHMFRAVSLGIGLALLVVTGTAAMIGALSGPVPQAYHSALDALGTSPMTAALSNDTTGNDRVLYERTAGSDGNQHWVLVGNPSQNQASSAKPERFALAGDTGMKNVSYVLKAKPAGLNKPLKNCSGSTGTEKYKVSGAYDLSCTRVG